MRPATRSSRLPRPIKVHTDTTDKNETTATKEKGKKPRHRMTNRQLEHLEALYQKATHPSRQEKELLASKVAMDMRTVTVWFQNRRQLAKKLDETALRDGASIHPALNAYRNPLSVVHQPDQNVVQPSDKGRGVALQKAMSTLQAAACKQTDSALDSGLSPPIRREDTLVQIHLGEPDDEQMPAQQKTGSKRMLEWATSRSEKRARIQPGTDEEDDGGDTTEEEDTVFELDSEPEPKCQPPKVVTIPTEYTGRFAPDVVFGASLLLTFKYSSA